MAKDTGADTGENATPKLTHEAKLVHGKSYYLGNKRFDEGKSMKVTADEADELSKAEVFRSVTTADGETVFGQDTVKQFEVTKLSSKDQDEDEPTPTARKR